MRKKVFKNGKKALAFALALSLVVQPLSSVPFASALVVNAAVENKYEAKSGTHGATYDAANKQVTFFVKNNDQFYGQTDTLWYKEYNSYAEAATAHVSNGGNFIDGVGATSLTVDGDQKTYTVDFHFN